MTSNDSLIDGFLEKFSIVQKCQGGWFPLSYTEQREAIVKAMGDGMPQKALNAFCAGLGAISAQASPAKHPKEYDEYVPTHEEIAANPTAVLPSEISVNIMPVLLNWAKSCGVANVITNGEAIRLANELSPYLRTTKPVSVSLPWLSEVIADSVTARQDGGVTVHTAKLKSWLEAAGVAYVE